MRVKEEEWKAKEEDWKANVAPSQLSPKFGSGAAAESSSTPQQLPAPHMAQELRDLEVLLNKC